MQISTIKKLVEKFDGESYVDLFINERTEAIGLGRIKSDAVVCSQFPGDDLVSITNVDGVVMTFACYAIMGFFQVPPSVFSAHDVEKE